MSLIKESQNKFNGLLNDLLDKIAKETNEGAMLDCAKDMKAINKEFNAICQLATEIRKNKYYTRHIAREKKDKQTITLTEEEKMKSGNYLLCSCGRYIKRLVKYNRDTKEYTPSDSIDDTHLTTQVHYQGLRNRKYGGKNNPETNTQIEREIKLDSFIYRHLTYSN